MASLSPFLPSVHQGAQGADELSWIGSQILPVTLNSHRIWNQRLELVCSVAPGTDS